jgi:signal transduction histidine kinase
MMDNRTSPLVLLADDEVHTTVMLSRIFEREGYRTQSVHDGAAALEAAQSTLPDLILLDVMMPQMNGFDVLRALRENAKTAGIPTILITAKARQAADVAHGLNLGADDYIQKPFDPRELLARAQSKVRSRQLELALQRRSQELEALLRAGEELNQHLELDDLLNRIPRLALDFLPGEIAAIFLIDDDQHVTATRILQRDSERPAPKFDERKLIKTFKKRNQDFLWPGTPVLVEGFNSGMAIPLENTGVLLGLLLVMSNEYEYDESHLRLFKGIGRQAALTLRNAQLYEIQANYALHLEDMVEEQTAELKSAQQMLIRAEKLASIGRLAASIAHEINNPLQPIRINLEDMLEDIQHNIPIDIRAVQTTQESVERIRRIVSQLLEFAGKRNPTAAEVQLLDINSVLESVVNLNRKFFEKEGLNIATDLAELPAVYGNKDQLEQVFMNMVLNAKAAMERGGQLKIRSRLEKEQVVISFIDNGCGIPADQINNIFDPFFSTKANGTGLGLFVSYGIIQSHHGTIDVQSKVNKGTTFTVSLPVTEPQDSETPA